MPLEKRIDAIVLAKNIIASIFIGVSDEKHQTMLYELKDAGFITVPITDIVDYQDAEKLYEEAYQNYAVIIAIDSRKKTGKVISDSNDFATFICQNNSITLGVYIWYASPQEVKRLAASQQLVS